jgi:ribonucleoside-diphosphate reductase alpha chain
MGGDSTGPTAFMQSVNEIGRHTMQGGSRRAAIWAGLHWWHPDVFAFMALKDWPDYLVQAKEDDYNAAAPMDMTNISVILDTAFFEALDDPAWERTYSNGESAQTFTVDHEWAWKVYWTAVEKMLTTGEPGFSVDAWENEGENLRNACTEVTSADDNDICNLGSINMARIDHLRVRETGGTWHRVPALRHLYSKVPYQAVDDTREKNRRLGLGLMGIYEWLVKRGYAIRAQRGTGRGWRLHQERPARMALRRPAGVSAPVKTRAIAPTGTIGILAETTTGIEPLFALAYKRRYLKKASGTTSTSSTPPPSG